MKAKRPKKGRLESWIDGDRPMLANRSLITNNRLLSSRNSDVEIATSDVDDNQDVSQQLSNDLRQELKLDEDELVKKYDGKVLPDHLRGKLWQVRYIVDDRLHCAGCLADCRPKLI